MLEVWGAGLMIVSQVLRMAELIQKVGEEQWVH